MNLGIDPVSNVASAAAKIISLFKEDPTVKAQLAQSIELTELQGEIQSVLAQVQVDSVEAASHSVFVAGWRPAVGWVCGFALAYHYVLQPFLQFALVAFKINFNAAALPNISTGELFPLLMGLLGLTAARTYEKVQGAAAPGQIGH